MRVYIAGPMTGIPQYNFPAFDAAADLLRAMGYEVVSPAELDDPEDRERALQSLDGAPQTAASFGKSWADFLARDVKLITDGGIDAIITLAGWERSRGARLETFVGYLNGMHIWSLHHDHLVGTSLGYLLEAWGGHRLTEDLDAITSQPGWPR